MRRTLYAIECLGAYYSRPDTTGPYPFVWTGLDERICWFADREKAEKKLREIQQFEPGAGLVEKGQH